MKKICLGLLTTAIFISCNNNNTNAPDVSGINVPVEVQRFDEDFFRMDTLAIDKSLTNLQLKYPDFAPLFFQNILGVTDAASIRTYFRLYHPVFDSSQNIYSDFDPIKKQIEQALKYVKHYFPSYKVPLKVKTVVGPMNSMQDFAMMGNGDYTPDFLGQDFIGISLQFYLGNDFSLYKTEYFLNNVAPAYRSRRFTREYIISDVMKLITEDIFPDKSKGRPLLDQMIEKGKQWWMLDKFLPGISDTIKTGYTKQQLDWCNKNEGLIWSYLTKNEELHSITPSTIQIYIGEAPFTQGFSQELSPGNIGTWIGWQIVKKFAANNASMKPEAVMHTSPDKIMEESRYKPK